MGIVIKLQEKKWWFALIIVIFIIWKNSNIEKINRHNFFGYIRGEWFIPYPGNFRETHLPLTFWDIPRISYIPRKQKHYVPKIWWDIPGIYYIPKKQNFSIYLKFFGIYHGISHIPENRKFLCTGFFFWDLPGIFLSRKSEFFYVPVFFWDIPYTNIF